MTDAALIRRLRDSLAKLREHLDEYTGPCCAFCNATEDPPVHTDSCPLTEAAAAIDAADRALAPKGAKKHRWRWVSAAVVSRPTSECLDCGLVRIGSFYKDNRGRAVDVAVNPNTAAPVTPPCEVRT